MLRVDAVLYLYNVRVLWRDAYGGLHTYNTHTEAETRADAYRFAQGLKQAIPGAESASVWRG